MAQTKNYFSEHEQLRHTLEESAPPPAGKTDPASCARLWAEHQAEEARLEQDPAQTERFHALARRAVQMAEELLLDIKTYIQADQVGVISLTAERFSIDESCSPAARQTIAELFCTGDPIWVGTEAGRCRMVFTFKLRREKKRLE